MLTDDPAMQEILGIRVDRGRANEGWSDEMVSGRVLVAEDDKAVRDSLVRALTFEGYDVTTAADGAEALMAVLDTQPDVIVLDVLMPHVDGLTACRKLRERGDRTPVLMLTARHETADRVAGLDAGADDYLVKPFDVKELLARLRAVIRRQGGQAAPVLSNGRVSLNPATGEARAGELAATLSARELALLQALLQHPGRIFSRTELETHLYGWGQEVESNAIDFLIHGVRKKLGADVIKNVRGAGWLVEHPR